MNIGCQHWVLFVTSVPFFSVGPYFRRLCDYLVDEHVRKGRGPSQWAHTPNPLCTRQTLPGDCGPFICLYAFLATDHRPPLIPPTCAVDVRRWVLDSLTPYTCAGPSALPLTCLPPWLSQVHIGITGAVSLDTCRLIDYHLF